MKAFRLMYMTIKGCFVPIGMLGEPTLKDYAKDYAKEYIRLSGGAVKQAFKEKW